MRNIVLLLPIIVLSTACTSFSIHHINPTPGYTNVVEVDQGRTRTLYVAGQVGLGNTMEEQFRSSFEAVLKQLKDADAEFESVVKMTLYIVDYNKDYLSIISKVRKEIFGTGNMPAITMVGVDALALPEMKVETEVVAVVKRR